MQMSHLIILGLALVTVPALAAPTVIHNTDPAHPPRTITLEEQWRVGGEDGDLLFGLVIQAASDAEGNVYLLDRQLCHVEVIAPDGEHLRTISGQGEGPGEVRAPIDLVMMDDGSVGILELFPSKLVTMATDGKPGQGLIMKLDAEGSGIMISISCQQRAGVLLAAGHRAVQNPTSQKRNMYLGRFDAEGRRQVEYCQHSAVLSFAPATFNEADLLPAFFFASTVGPDGRVYAATSTENYHIEVFQSDGTPDRIIERAFTNRPRSDRELSRITARVDSWYREVPGEVERHYMDHEVPINEIFVTDEGTVWVCHNRSHHDLPAGIMASYDTFDSQGNYLQEVHVAHDADPAYDGLVFLGDDRVLQIKGLVLSRLESLGNSAVEFGEVEDESAMEVICYRISQ